MKPKNRYFCMGCQRPKMLFESKSKADNFLKFNKDDFDKTPTRSYFCSFCGGWHISSLSSLPSIISANERADFVLQSLTGSLTETINNRNSIEYKEFNRLYGHLITLNSRIRVLITATDYGYAGRLMKKSQLLINEMIRHTLSCGIRDERQRDIEKGFAQLDSFLRLLVNFQNKPDISEETLETKFQDHRSSYCRKALGNLKNKIIFLRIISELGQSETETEAERHRLIQQAESIIKSGFRGGGCSNLRKWAKALLNDYV